MAPALFAPVLFALALAPRLALAFAWAGEAVWDGHYYDFGARRIAAGLGYSDDLSIAGTLVWHPWCHYPVGYSAFLAAFYRVLGATTASAALANGLVGASLAVVTWLLGREALSEGRARAAGVVVALHPGLVAYSALVMSEPLAALLTLAAFWLAVRSGSPRGLLGAALLLGVGTLVRPQALLCAPFLPLALRPPPSAAREWPRRGLRFAGAAVLTCAVALLPVLPWTARNCRVMDGCALVSTNAGWNLAIGAFPRATGRFETLRASDGCREVTGQVQQDRCWLHYGLAQITAHPGRWLGLVPAKLGYTFDHESFAVEYLHEAKPEAWPEGRRAFGRGTLTAFHRVLLAASALAGVAWVMGARASRPIGAGKTQGALAVAWALVVFVPLAAPVPVFWPTALFAAVVPWLPLPGRPPLGPALKLPLVLLATTVLTHAVFFGEDRYHVVASPVLALLALAALRAPDKSNAAQAEAHAA